MSLDQGLDTGLDQLAPSTLASAGAQTARYITTVPGLLPRAAASYHLEDASGNLVAGTATPGTVGPNGALRVSLFVPLDSAGEAYYWLVATDGVTTSEQSVTFDTAFARALLALPATATVALTSSSTPLITSSGG